METTKIGNEYIYYYNMIVLENFDKQKYGNYFQYLFWIYIKI